MGEPKPPRVRRPTLSAALKAARAAGLTVTGATMERGKLVLTFADGSVVTGTNATESEWDVRLRKLGYGKN